jgi:hypothetical protein
VVDTSGYVHLPAVRLGPEVDIRAYYADEYARAWAWYYYGYYGADIARAVARGITGSVLPGSRKAPDPVKRTQVAVQLLGTNRSKCHWLSHGHFVSVHADRGKCDKPVWQDAKMTFKPHNKLVFKFLLPKALPHGRYHAIGRAILKSGISNHTYPPGIDSVTFTR